MTDIVQLTMMDCRVAFEGRGDSLQDLKRLAYEHGASMGMYVKQHELRDKDGNLVLIAHYVNLNAHEYL